MGSVGSLSHLSKEDKEDILFEISFFLSDKGFIEGCSLLERMSSVLDCPLDEFTVERIKSIRENRRKR